MWQSIRRNVTWRAIPIAGFIAGTVFLVIHVLLTQIMLEVNAAIIPRYFASLLLGSDVLLDDSPSIIVVGIIVHYILSFVFTLIITFVIHRWGLLIGIIGGGLLGLAIYVINLYTFTVWFEWFFAMNSPVLVISHILFGMMAGGVYELFDHYDMPFEVGGRHETD